MSNDSLIDMARKVVSYWHSNKHGLEEFEEAIGELETAIADMGDASTRKDEVTGAALSGFGDRPASPTQTSEISDNKQLIEKIIAICDSTDGYAFTAVKLKELLTPHLDASKPVMVDPIAGGNAIGKEHAKDQDITAFYINAAKACAKAWGLTYA